LSRPAITNRKTSNSRGVSFASRARLSTHLDALLAIFGRSGYCPRHGC
jgi:hypothetical protein